ncbi:MAG: hypothetical protein ACRCU2_12930, partial [Planktothrix sp.]
INGVTQELNKYINNKYPGQNKSLNPPIAIVLDMLQVSVNWRDPSNFRGANEPRQGPSCTEYQILFDVVAERLDAIANFYTVKSGEDTIPISNEIIPANFRVDNTQYKFVKQSFNLPPEAVLWVQRMQTKNREVKEAISFLDLFVLLIILGGFGSWVYLLRLHLDDSRKVNLEEYFYRPVLGMALALAIFIINLSVHSVVSKSEIDKVRQEPLIVLAFIAGFLSDRTYSCIEQTARKKMAQDSEEPKSPSS